MNEALASIHKVLEQAPGLARVLPSHVARYLLDGVASPVDALKALDDLAFISRRSQARPRLWPLIDSARSALGPELERIAVRSLPPPRSLPRDLTWARLDQLVVTTVPWPAAPGTVVALERRTIVDVACPRLEDDDERAHVHVASGSPRTTRLDVLEAALVAIEAAAPTREDHERLLRLIDDCERDDPRANSEAAVRFAVGCIERAKAIPKARAVALDFLASSGIAPIALEAGVKWDAEKHPASAFERKRVKGPAGRVVATETTGFKDANGVVLARAVVAVGDG